MVADCARTIKYIITYIAIALSDGITGSRHPTGWLDRCALCLRDLGGVGVIQEGRRSDFSCITLGRPLIIHKGKGQNLVG